MADDNELLAEIAENESEALEVDSQGAPAEPSTLLHKLKGAISKSVQSKVDGILQDVQKFSDYAKLYLYLQLPSGPSSGEKSLDLASLSSVEHMHACTWIRNHLEEYPDTCLPKQDVYDAYKRHCDNLCSRSLSAANFGKIIREIFPNIKARRLGGRGQSKYCYSGIRRKTVVHMPPLPSLDLKETETTERADLVPTYNDEVMDAACALTCDWAEKILKRTFNNIVEVAQFLIQQHIINPRSAHADLVMAMVVSETAEPPREKRLPPSTKKNESEAQENAAKPLPQAKKENPSKPPAAPPRDSKKAAEAAAKPPIAPQVSALMARLRLLLPRVQPVERLVVSPGVAAIHSSPPVLEPKLMATPVGGTVKMALSVGPTPSPLPLNLAPAVNGPGAMVSQQSAVPVINMILPGVAVPPTAEIPAKPRNAPGGGGVASSEPKWSLPDPLKARAPSKRPAESSTDAATVKRKRGRPRKKADEPDSCLPEKATGEEEASGTKEDSDVIVVTVGYGDCTSLPSTQRGPQKEGPEAEMLPVGDTKGSSPRDTGGTGLSAASSHVVGNPAKAAILPSQVSVIQGHRSGTQSLLKEAGSQSHKPVQSGQGLSGPEVRPNATLARDSVPRSLLEDAQSERSSSSESESEPQDLSISKSVLPSSKDHSDATSLRGSVMRLHRNSVERDKGGKASPPVTSAHAPSR
ncbi:PREDICTED: DNA-binding protein RFX5 [Gekko japonicus]|uniref:DNA-binding protein RFX5 n=1 Tax=Gekko japonicus TaxID=146911 RepID=A0ABM1KYH3_GEKJA|nr:PREDICTED: DNA-binding protein RFX5 [Gekko japonicus]